MYVCILQNQVLLILLHTCSRSFRPYAAVSLTSVTCGKSYHVHSCIVCACMTLCIDSAGGSRTTLQLYSMKAVLSWDGWAALAQASKLYTCIWSAG